MSVQENIEKAKERILKACDSSGRKREEITLMGVSKFVPVSKIEEAVKAGIFCFGESRVQEAAHKFAAEKPDDLELRQKNFSGISIHMIGSLQRNKAKTAVNIFDCIQSVDRTELIAELAKHVQDKERPLEVLLELHTGEESKSGFADFDSLFKGAEAVLSVSGLKPAGLMTMAPYFEDMSKPEPVRKVRSAFRQLVKAQGELEKRFPGYWSCLSMGMSNDFEIAVEEGSTMLRIGSLIFKE